jgi:hypothetical protein
MTSHGALLPTTKQGCGALESNHRRNCKVNDEDDRDAWEILGRSGHEGRIHPQMVAVVHHLQVFGCITYMKITRPHLAKLDDRGLKMVFIGYEPGSKVYRLYNSADGRVHVSHDVIFDENTFWSWDDIDNTGVQDGEPFTVEYLITEPGEGEAPDHAVSPAALGPAPSLMLTPRTPAPSQVSSLAPMPPPPAQ